MNKITVLISSILLTFHTFSYAQVTTSGISGRVSDETENLIGAFIKAVHTPSGTSYSAVTNTEGRYTIQGMRTGGPYRIEINYLGYTEYRKEHILLPLGETLVLNARLNKASRELGEVTVSGTQPKFTTEKTGITTHISPQEIALLPSINRGIADLTRLSPYASGMNFGGRDGRSNTFTIDGAHLNNNFGLNSDLPGGGNPISLEALEEVQINIAPFDVRQANFIGASINAITKSGTNTLKASAYSYIYNQNMRGNRIGDADLGARDAESRNSYGFTLGGPVIKDKLFFFVNAEYENSPGQITQWRASKDGQADAAHLISRTTEADMDEFSRILYERYNYKTGSYSNFPGGLTDLKIAGRLDWNINAQNRFSFRYNQVKNENWMGTNPNTAEPAPLSGNRISQDALSFFNSCYATVNTVKTATVELNSRATNNMFNQLLLTYTHINQGRDTHSEPFPFIDILQADEQGNIKPYMSAGYELFTWNTETTNQVVNAVDNYTFYSGNHKLTAGLSFEYQTASTSYMSNGLGYYRFSSFDDFKNGAAPEAFALCYGYDDVKQAGVVSFVQSAAYLQDEWNLRDNLSLTAGLRFDHTNFVNDILRNQAIYDLDFGGKHVDTSVWPETTVQISPRIGFSYDVFQNQRLTIRGGSGIFTGRTPLVYLANMPVSAGMYQNLVVYQNKTAEDRFNLNQLHTADGKLITNVHEMVSALSLPTQVSQQGSVPGAVAGVDSHFKMPQVWKTALGIDYAVPSTFPLTLSVEGTYLKDINAIRMVNYNLKEPGTWEYLHNGPDDRWIYPADASYRNETKGAYVLTNTHQGWGYTGNITVRSTPTKDLNLMLAYTHTESREISGMPSSTASSAWSKVPSVNGPNFSRLERSQYLTPDKLTGSLMVRIPYLKNRLSTDIGLFYAGYSPYSYSYIYSNDINNDGITNDLIYIPKNKNEIAFKTAQDANLFWHFLENDRYLSRHKGQYAEAFAVNAPWMHRFDLKIVQNFSIKSGNNTNTLQVSVDILNVGNLLNSTWGLSQQMLMPANGKILTYNKDDKTYSFFSQNKIDRAFANDRDVSQTWKLQVGVRYIFH